MDQADQTSLSSNMGSQLFMLFSWPMPLLGNGMGIVWVEPGQKLRRWVFLSSSSSFSSLSQPATATGAGSVLAQKETSQTSWLLRTFAAVSEEITATNI